MSMQQRMKDTREDADHSQRQTAALMGISQDQYWKYETKGVEMPPRYLKQFCAVYGVSADYILGLPKGLKWPR